MRFELFVADPMIHDRELEQRGRKCGQEDILEQSHQRKLIAHLDPNIVTHDGIDELRRFHYHPLLVFPGVCYECCQSRHWT